MSKKKKVQIQGFGKPVSLKKKILKPLTKAVESQFGAIRPGDKQNEGATALKSTKKLIKSLAADGKLGKKDMGTIQSFLSSNKAGKHFEPALLSGSTTGVLDAAKYSGFVKGQKGEINAFRKEQTGLINQALQQSISGLGSMLDAMSSDASGALSGFTKLLDRSMSRMSRSVDRQQAAFDRQNAQSERTIARYQNRIASLPKPPKNTKMISDKISEVSAGDPFESIAQRRAPIQVQTSPAFTGFNLAQQESQARQMQGLSGFRSSRA
jgi:hypothetical protein